MAGQVSAGGLGDTDEQQGEPAEQDVGADAVFQAVVDRAQVEHRFHVAPAAFDFQQLLVAQGDVLSREFRVGAAQQVLAVQALLGFDLRGVDAEQAFGCHAQEPVEAGLGGDLPAQFGASGGTEGVRSGDLVGQVGDEMFPDVLVAFGFVGGTQALFRLASRQQ